MAQSPDDIAAEEAEPARRPRKLLRKIAAIALVLLLAVVMYTWTVREQIARDLIAEQLESFDVPASYDIAEIAPDRQVLTNIIVGDPDNPDLTIERAEIGLAYGFGVPEIGRVTLVNPRLYSTYRNGQLSFGSLDPILFAESDEPAGLPDWDLKLVDGRALIESDYGDVGLKAEGEGQLSDGFTGIVATIAPKLSIDDCSIQRASLYGDVATASGRISLDGPVRVANLNCSATDVSLRDANLALELTADADFAGADIEGGLKTAAFRASGVTGQSVSGPIRLFYRDGKLDSRFDIAAQGVSHPQVAAGELTLDGALRGREGFANIQVEADIGGEGISLGRDFSAMLAEYRGLTADTLAEPLLAKLGAALQGKLDDARISASLTGRKTGDLLSLTVPRGDLTAADGATVLALTRLQYAQTAAQTPRVSGNFRFGGGNLPSLIGRMEQSEGGRSIFRLRMAEYAAGDSALEIPELVVTQVSSGAVGFAGSVEASGPLPGGSARNLRLPLSGNWSSGGGLSLWRSCTQIGFDALSFANLELSRQNLTLCPSRGNPILQQDSFGLRIAAGLPSLNLSGTLAETPIRIASGPVGFAYPGVASARELTVSLGPAGEANAFAISDLTAQLGEGISGTFSDADISLFAVPLDLRETSGDWSYEAGAFRLENGAFRLFDRADIPRFNPMLARDATLSLEENIIQANALIRHPDSDRELSKVSITHNLQTSTGFADLQVDGVRFDDQLQPDELTPLALGVVANAEGVVTGTGRIDWNPQDITSSGQFSSESLDFAAVFGPVKGASGTVEFVDLLSLTTAPNQQVRVASVNPGIEANDGVIGFSLRDGQYLGVTGGTWPFMGGTLRLRPVDLNFGVEEARRYVLEVEGLDAALFVENLELGNLAARGLFDGALPLEFDAQGFGRIEGGLLNSRPPGGNVSYVGELTYEDMSAITNYTFDMLKSLDYERMQIAMDGPLTGDIVTKIRFDGVKQGEGTKQNFITRQIADLPIRMNVNITAPFYKLVTTLKSMYDPSTVRDPRELGLLGDDGTRFVPAGQPLPAPELEPAPEPLIRPEDIAPDQSSDEPSIQTPDSENMP